MLGKLSELILNHFQDKLYDDFIPEFTGAKFNASGWINLFATAGAKYFVLVTVRYSELGLGTVYLRVL